MSEDVKKILEKTREILTPPEKWIKHTFELDGCYCLLGAMNQAVESLHLQSVMYSKAITVVHSVICDRTKLSVVPVSWWNDDEDTTHEMVLEVLDEAIARVSK